VAPGDFRTISELNRTDHNANSNGWPSAFNNLGQIAFWASFTDGSQGIFVSNKVATVPGDFNFDGTVDAADFVMWRKTGGGQAAYDNWKKNFDNSIGSGAGADARSAVPEPTTLSVLFLYVAALLRRRSSRGAR
jgi:hypothetical protein